MKNETLVKVKTGKPKADSFSKILELRHSIIHEGTDEVQGTEHRLEFITTIAGVDYINDSKATNLNLTWYSLERMTKPIIWITSGLEQGQDYSMLKEMVGDKVKAIICLGKDNSKLFKTFVSKVEVIIAAFNAEEAVISAQSVAETGDVVLLSPGCSSFDLFDSYEDRGTKFKKAVKKLKKL